MKKPISRGQRIRSFARIFFGIIWDFWREARLARRAGLREAEKRMASRHQRRAAKLRETATEVGGVLIKLGQFIGSRVDVMPEPYIVELMKLQDEVPPEEPSLIKARIEEEFQRPLEEVFAIFNPVPRAAASLAQVHEAVLPTGEKVAVKVQRPGIEKLIDIDLATFAYLMEGLRRFTRIGQRVDVWGLVEEFSRTLGEELDFYREGFHAERFRKNFEGDSTVYIPKVYWDYTTDRVVTLEYVGGIKINDYEALDKAGIDRHHLSQTLVEIYVKQFLDHGFFHADPHPGNLFVLPGRTGPEVTFVDFGMVGEITPEMRQRFIDVLLAITRRDTDAIIEGAVALGFIRRGVSLAPIRNAIEWMFERYAGVTTTREITFESLDEIQEDIRAIMRENPFNLPVHFAYLGKAFATMVGLLAGLDPTFDIIEEARPFIERLREEARRELPTILLNEAKEIGRVLLSLPRRLDRALSQIERGELRVRNFSPRAAEEAAQAARTRRTVGLNVFAASMVGGSVALYLYDFVSEAYTLFALGILIFLLSLRYVRQSRQ
jgi:predicted unusual protein kinase regulating ubiquinone biosynthesis (AarF/ABC1/UbiB family)